MKNIIFLLALLSFSTFGFTQESSMKPKEMKAYMKKAANRTNPDYVCFVPGSYDRSTRDTDNEHFLVFDGPDGSLMAIWTQHQGTWAEMQSHIVFSRSDDKGITWSPPMHLAGPRDTGDNYFPAVWGFPMVSASGRIYVLWNQNQGLVGWNNLHTGTMSGIYSDDNGKSWSQPQNIPMPKSPYDDPEGKIPAEWIVWQKPERAPDGKYTIGYSRWVNKAVAWFNGTDRRPNLPSGSSMSWVWWESVVEFMKFENLDSNPEPEDLVISYHAWGDQALRVPHYIEPCLSLAQEPSIVTLPDNRLFCTMRTGSGYIWYSLSGDNGKTWCNPRPLLRRDYGSPILQPVSCCPIYQLADGRYVLLHHNNRGDSSDPSKKYGPRTPAYVALGEFRPGADQPIWFSESKVFVDNKSLNPAGERVTSGSDAATYTSFTTSTGKNILWYPDAKCWLLGKEVSEEFLKGLKVPSFTDLTDKKEDHKRKPNVVVLFIDDLGYGDVGAFGCPDIPTPHIDRLARQGVRCTNAYTVCPVCSPSRTAIMTGMYPNRFGKFGNEDRGAPIPEDHPTLAEFMCGAGFFTGMVGRWDIGEPDQGPLAEGFMEVARRSSLPGNDPRRALSNGPSYFESDGVYLTDRQGDEMVDFVTRHRDEPFFLYFAPLGIHYPVQEAPGSYQDRVPQGISDEHRRNLAAALIAVDDAVGKLMGRLGELGLDEETLVIFTGDNGGQEQPQNGSQNPALYGGASNHPYRGGKATSWEGAVHEPFIVRWTNHLPAGTTFEGMLSTMDVYATAAAVAGKIAPPGCEGIDMLPYLTGDRRGDIHEILYWRWLEGANPRSVHAVRKQNWRLMKVREEDQWQLYDIIADPGETTDLATKHPEIVEELDRNYTEWARTLPPPSGKHREPGGRMPTGTGWATPEDP